MLGVLGLCIKGLVGISIVGGIACYGIKTFKKCKKVWKEK